MRGPAIAAMVVAALAVTRIAVADPVDATEAGQAFQRGRDLAKDGRFPEACAEFGHSYELDPALGTAVNLADCLEHLGQLRRAWQLFDLVARAQGQQSRARFARQRADALLPRLATLVVTVREPAAPGLTLRIGEQTVPPAAEIRELVEPTDVAITATLPGRPAFRATVHAVAGAMNTIEVPAFAAPEAAAEARRRRPYVYLAGGLAAAGAVGLAASVVLGLGARSAYHDALDTDCAPANIAGDTGYARCRARVDRAGVRADHATAIAIGGALLAAAATAVFVAAPRESVQVAPLADRRALGLGVVGRF
jgi:tetratricopeptide (TPR) repeat protein